MAEPQHRAFSIALTTYLVPEPRGLPDIMVHLDPSPSHARIDPVEFTAKNKADFLTGVTQVANELWETMARGGMIND